MTLIPNFQFQVNPDYNFPNTEKYRGIPHFNWKIFLLIFSYFINQYMVIDDVDSEFCCFRSAGLLLSEYRRIPRITAFYRENIFYYFLIFFKPANGNR